MFSQKTNFNEYILPIRFCYKTPKQTTLLSKKIVKILKLLFVSPWGKHNINIAYLEAFSKIMRQDFKTFLSKDEILTKINFVYCAIVWYNTC